MSSRADVLGALLEGTSVATAETQLRSQAHISGQLAAERKKLGSMPSNPSEFNAKHPRGGKGSTQGGKFIKKGSSGTPVNRVQARLGVRQTGSFAFDTEAAVRNFQRQHGLQVDGVVGAQTAQALLGNRNAKAVKPGALSSADAHALGVSTSTSKRSSSSAAKKAAASRKAKLKPSAPVRAGGGLRI